MGDNKELVYALEETKTPKLIKGTLHNTNSRTSLMIVKLLGGESPINKINIVQPLGEIQLNNWERIALFEPMREFCTDFK